MVNGGSPLVWILLIAVIVLIPATFMYLATTFLFAFSGGQYRMVAVVNLGAIAVIALGGASAALGWRLRGAPFAALTAGAATAIGWAAAVGVEWLLSFRLGA
jgi:hypothetical protein